MATVGRERELGTIAAFLGGAQTDGDVLVLEGEAGIGKTTLWRAGIEQAAASGYRVVACAPAGSETQLAFTALRDLLGDAFDEFGDELPPPQQRALGVMLLREEPDAAPPQPDAIAVGTLSLLRVLATRGRTLVAIDDVQWLDAASSTALAYALRRVVEGPAILLAVRADDGQPRMPLLERVDPERVRTIHVGSLTVGALGRILHASMGVAYPRPTLHRLREVSDGNPLFALELARALGPSPAPLKPGEPLPVPRTLRQLVRDRLLSLPESTLDALTVVSASSRSTLALATAAAVLGIDPTALLKPALETGVALVEGEAVRFTHTVLGAAVYALALPQRRRDIHRRLADVVQDVEERARHLALATETPHADVARLLDNGAAAAFARGGPNAAAELAAHARRLTPPDAATELWRRSLTEADYHFAAGDTRRASQLLEELVEGSPPGPLRARALSRRARLLHFGRDIDGSVNMLYDALREAGDDIQLQVEVEEGLAWGLLLVRRDLEGAAEHARSAADLADRRNDSAALAEALAVQALVEFVLGRPWRPTMDRALSLETALFDLRVLRHPSFAYGYCLSCADDLDGARAVFDELMRRAEEQGDESSMPSILNHLTIVECLAGNWGVAARHADECYVRALESGQQPTQASILGKKALLAARRGAAEEAREKASLALPADFDAAQPELAMARGGETAIWALGSLELSLGDPERAHAQLGPLTEALVAAGVREPGEARTLPDDVEALVLLERYDKAEALARQLRAWARRLGRASALSAAARCDGLLHAARGDAESALAGLENAAALAEEVPLPFERARTLLALGEQQRRARQRRAARKTLEQAFATFEELGAQLWAERARAELARIGGRRSSGELTPTETRIATLVAEGKKNKEVAAALVVTERTVESALTQIYRKLEVRSRTELARKIAETD